jgi:cytidylate kinase
MVDWRLAARAAPGNNPQGQGVIIYFGGLPMAISIHLSEHARPILGAIRTVPIPAKFPEDAPPPPVPFVTISREVGAGAWTMARRLCEVLNQSDSGAGEHPWTCWERELVEKVISDFHLSRQLVESLEEGPHSWLGDFLASLTFSNDPANATETTVFSKVALTVRALAQAGRVIIVGCGGVFLTHQMPGGVHVRLDAPLENRIQHMMRRLNVSREKAARELHERSKNRSAFCRLYWPEQPVRPDLFTITINTAAVSQETCVEVIASLVKDLAQNRAPLIAAAEPAAASAASAR